MLHRYLGVHLLSHKFVKYTTKTLHLTLTLTLTLNLTLNLAKLDTAVIIHWTALTLGYPKNNPIWIWTHKLQNTSQWPKPQSYELNR